MAIRLPLFPIDVVLFPGIQLPLHIFEPRYRALLADVTAAEGRFGILPGGPDGAPPASGTIGTVARVVAAQPMPDGRSTVLVVGEERFILRGIVDGATPYLTGRLEPFSDAEGAQELPSDLVWALRLLGERCRVAMRVLSDLENDTPWSEAAEPLTFEIAATIPWPTTDARPLLAMRSAAERATYLLQLLPRLVPELEERAAVHRRAGSNGHGPHGATLPDAP